MNQKLWGGAFAQPTHHDVEQFTSSIAVDCELFYEDILGSFAHSDMLKECQLIDASTCQQLHDGLHQLIKLHDNSELSFSIADEDIHMNIERQLGHLIGEAANNLHTARSRNDQVALDLHLYTRKKVLVIIDLLLQLQKTLLDLSQAYPHAILPGYTHLQRAQPILLSDYWLAYLQMFSRDIDRLKACWQQLNRSPLGACALTGTTLPTNKDYVAKLLGFDDVYQSALDAVSNRDFVIDFISAASVVMMHISRLSEELILWNSFEFNFIRFDDAFSTGSSIMPQKKNPDVAEIARGKCARVYGSLTTLLTLMKGLPLTYNRDMQEDKEPLFDTVKTLTTTLRVYIPLLATLKFDTARMQAALKSGFSNATALAEYLVRVGVPFRNAHELTGKIVAYCTDKAVNLDELTLSEMQTFHAAITPEIFELLKPENIVQAYTNRQPQDVLRAGVSDNEKWLAEHQGLLKKVYEQYQVPLIL